MTSTPRRSPKRRADRLALTITDTLITSYLVERTARYSDRAAADGFGAWIAAVQLAEDKARLESDKRPRRA